MTHFRYHRPRHGPWLQLGSVAGWEWNRVEVTIADLPPDLNGLRMVQISDLHLRSRWPRRLDEVIDRVNADPPGLILFTGDFVDDKYDHRAALPHVERLISRLLNDHGIFAIVGNHDMDLLAPHLARFGVQLMVHRRVEVPIGAARIELIGLPGPERGDFDNRFVDALPPRRAGAPRIVLSHYPDLLRNMISVGRSPDVYLAGHTHGGQICLPNEYPILRHDSFPRRLCKGAHEVGGTCLVVSRGFGFTTLPLRIFCPAEVIEIVLRAAD